MPAAHSGRQERARVNPRPAGSARPRPAARLFPAGPGPVHRPGPRQRTFASEMTTFSHLCISYDHSAARYAPLWGYGIDAKTKTGAAAAPSRDHGTATPSPPAPRRVPRHRPARLPPPPRHRPSPLQRPRKRNRARRPGGTRRPAARLTAREPRNRQVPARPPDGTGRAAHQTTSGACDTPQTTLLWNVAYVTESTPNDSAGRPGRGFGVVVAGGGLVIMPQSGFASVMW